MNPEYKSLSRYVSSYLGSLKTHSVVIKDQEWKYIDGGKGETIVFLHGLTGSKMVWRSLMQSYAGKYRVIAVDIPGMFVEQRLNNRKHTFRELANWLELFLESLQVDKFHLISHSIGCCIATCFASNHPSRISSVTLLNHPNVMIDNKSGQLTDAFDLLLNPEVLETSEGWDKAFASLFYSPPKVPKIIQRHRQRSLLKHREGFRSVVHDSIELKPMAMTYLRKLLCPVLTVSGSHDLFSGPAFHNILKTQLPRGRHALLDECGHVSFLEKSEEVLALHKDFLKSAHCTDSNKVPEMAI